MAWRLKRLDDRWKTPFETDFFYFLRRIARHTAVIPPSLLIAFSSRSERTQVQESTFVLVFFTFLVPTVLSRLNVKWYAPGEHEGSAQPKPQGPARWGRVVGMHAAAPAALCQHVYEVDEF